MDADIPDECMGSISDQAELWAMWNGFNDVDEMKEWGDQAERERLAEQSPQKGAE